MPDQSIAVAGRERRKSERKPVSLPGKILHERGEVDCAVFDISPEGALTTAPLGVEVNQTVRMKVTANGEFLGLVVWRRGDRMGVKFMQFEDDGIRLPSGVQPPLRKVS